MHQINYDVLLDAEFRESTMFNEVLQFLDVRLSAVLLFCRMDLIGLEGVRNSHIHPCKFKVFNKTYTS